MSTVEILLSINQSVKDIAKSMAPKNGTGAEATAKVAKGNFSTTSDIDPSKKSESKINISTAGLGDVVSFLNSLSPTIIAISKISNRQVKRFTGTIDEIMGCLKDVTEYSKNNQKDIKVAVDMFNSMNLLTNAIKKSASLPIFAPLSLLGFTIARKVVQAYLEILKTIDKAGNVSKRIRKLNQIARSIHSIIGIMKQGALLLMVCMGLGLLVAMGPTRKMILYGLGVLVLTLLTTLAIIGLIGVVTRVMKMTGAIRGVRQIIALTLASLGIVILSYAIGAAISALGGFKSILFGLGIILGTVLVIALLFGVIGFVSRTFVNRTTLSSILGIILLTFAAMGIIVAAAWLGDYVKGKHKSIMAGLKATGTIMFALVAVGMIAGRLLNNAKQGIVALGVMEILALGAIGLAYLLMKLHLFKESNNIEWGDFYLDLAAISSIIVAMGGLAVAAGALIAFLTPGIVAMAGIEALALGAIGLTRKLLDLTILRKQNNIKYLDLAEDVGAIATVIGAIGVLATAFGFIAPFVLAGGAALIPTIKMAKETVDLTAQVIVLHKTMKENGVTWDELETDVDKLESVISTFGKVATQFGLVGPLVGRGMRGAKDVIEMAKGVISVTYELVNVSKAIDSAGGADKLVKVVSEDIKNIMSTFNERNFSVDASFWKLNNLKYQYMQIADLMKGVITVVDAISKITKVCGIVNENGELYPIRRIDPDTGEIEYSTEPVNLQKIAELITGTVKTFVDNMQFGLEDVWHMYNTKEIFRIFGSIIDPVTKFVEMLMKYDTGAEEGKLYALKLDENGVLKKNENGVDVKKVANLIAGVVSTFVTELYKKENTENWSELIYGDPTFFQSVVGGRNNRSRAVSEAAGVFGIIIDPICKFIDMIVGLEPTGTSLSKIYYDKNGNPQSGKPVNVIQAATVITKLISAFIMSIYGINGIAGKAKDCDPSLISNLLGPINTVVGIAEKVSSEKIVAAAITSNSTAISNGIGSILTMFASVTVDSEILKKYMDPLRTLVTIGSDLGNKVDGDKIIANSKSIATFMTDVVEKKLPKTTDTVNTFTESVLYLKSAFQGLDDVLIKEKDKRQEALKDFEDSMKEIIEMMNGSKDTFDSFSNVLTSVQNFDPAKLDEIKNYSSTGTSVVSGTTSQSTEQTNGEVPVVGTINQDVQVQQSSSITADEITEAIKNALFGISLTNTQIVDLDDDKNIDDRWETIFTFQGV